MHVREFDYVLIGGGPTAVASLQAFDATRSIAVLSGVTRFGVPRAEVHPKIQSVSVANRERPGVAPAFSGSAPGARPLFSSAVAGGLANYWGQQFIRYEANDKWPRHLFDSYESYAAHCTMVEQGFTHVGGSALNRVDRGQLSYEIRTPRLLVGSSMHPASGLMAMRNAFQHEVERTSAVLYDARAHSISRVKGAWQLLLQSGELIRGKKLLLAAGVVGTGQLVANSFPEVEWLEFSDHSPWMLYTTGLREIYDLRPSDSRDHFNALTLECIERDCSTAFASMYDMKQADLNLLLASTVGRTFSLLRGIGAPIGAGLLKPVQIWTPTSFDTIRVDLKKKLVQSMSPRPQPSADLVLDRMIELLGSLGAKVRKASSTPPGYGFHYHNLRVKPTGGKDVPLSVFLAERYGDDVMCVDASVLPEIGLRPHTLTAMAARRC